MAKICCIDFDDTLRDSLTELPIEGAREALEKLKENNFYIMICSCRTNHSIRKHPIDRTEEIRFMSKFLEENNIPFDEILDNDKPIADYYLDDCGRQINNNWMEVADSIIEEENSYESDDDWDDWGNKKEPKFEFVAILEGSNPPDYRLTVEYDGEPYADIPWPESWEEKVSSQFLESKGFRVVIA